VDFTEQMMKQTQKARNHSRLNKVAAAISLFLLTLILAPLAMAKINVDFDPSLVSQSSKHLLVGGANELEFRTGSDLISNQVHTGVSKALIQHGLKEVRPDQQPDLVCGIWPIAIQAVSAAVELGTIRTVYWRLLGLYLRYDDG